MNEVLGLNEHAWQAWIAYRKQIRKPLKVFSHDAAKKRLASFGDGQMEAVLTSIANGWTGVFPPGKKAPAVVKAEEKAKQRAQAEELEFLGLRIRAEKVGFRQPYAGEDLIGYKTLVQRAEANNWKPGVRHVAAS